MIVLVFVAIGPAAFTSDWVSSSDFHACIEISSSFIAIIAAVACLMYYFGLKSRFYLIVGLGFLVCGSEDLIHGILSFERLFADSGIDFSRFIPSTYVAGRMSLAIMIIAAPILSYMTKQVKNIKCEAILFSSLAIILGGGLTALAFTIDLPQFIYPDRLISRPVDFISAIIFMLAFGLIFKRYRHRRDIFSGSLLICVLLNIGGQVYMSFSKQLFDIFFDIAHFANILSYCAPVTGITIQALVEMRKAKQAEEEIKAANKNLKQTNQTLQEFVYIASHDLQEPLRKVLAFGDRLKDNSGGSLGEKGADYLERMQNAAERMKVLINDLLTYSRVTTKTRPFEVVDLGRITNEVLSDLEVTIEGMGAKVEVGQLPILLADPIQMRQLIQNLISNALKFHKPDEAPVVKITSEISIQHSDETGTNVAEAEICRVIVEDNGIGFEQEYAVQIFEAFQRLHGRREYEGTGVGLAICQKIVQRHDGTITAKSSPGKGSTFIITFPAK